MTAGETAFGPHLPPGARINTEGRMTYCTNPAHRDGEHGLSCLPPPDPANPELRLIRAIWGLCGLCDRTDYHDHDEDRPRRAARRHRTMPKSPAQDAGQRAAESRRSQEARVALSSKIEQWQKDREAQDAQGSKP